MVIAFREGGRGDHRRVKISGLSRHERQLIAELAVARLEQGIRDRCTAWVVHAQDHHHGHITGRGGGVHSKRGVIQTVVLSPLVGIHAGHFVSSPILDGYRQVGRRKLLPEGRRERVEFRSEVVGDNAGEVRGDVS